MSGIVRRCRRRELAPDGGEQEKMSRGQRRAMRRALSQKAKEPGATELTIARHKAIIAYQKMLKAWKEAIRIPAEPWTCLELVEGGPCYGHNSEYEMVCNNCGRPYAPETAMVGEWGGKDHPHIEFLPGENRGWILDSRPKKSKKRRKRSR